MDPILLYSIPFFVLTMLGEWQLLRQLRRGAGYTAIDTAASLSQGIGYLVVAALLTGVTIPLYVWFSQFAPWDLSGVWWMWPALFVVEDFFYYWYHRAGHEMRFFWAAHVSHHSSQHYNLSTALRQSITTPFTGWIFWVPVVLLGFPVEAVMLQKAISLLYQYWIHTEAIGKLGPFEWVFNTPSHHRVHHASNLRYLDKNYGGILIVWDRLFGTFEPERDEEPVRYGLLHNLQTHNPAWIALHEWVSMVVDMIRKPSSALGYLFMRPGWHPDARSATVPQLLERARAAQAATQASEQPAE